MPRYASEPSDTKATSAHIGVLLINLGTPEAPTRAAVRVYLKEFLSDPRVVEIPRILWWPILNLFVLRTRPKASAARYAQIWMPEGSPLKVYTERQTTLLRGYLGERLRAPLVVDYAMRYGKPSIREKLAALKAQGCNRILLVPLYPQYSSSTTATALDAAYAALRRMRTQPELRVVRDFHDDRGYIGALAASVRNYWEKRGRPDVLVMSFHGVPRRAIKLGDPYSEQCQTSARLLADELGLKDPQYRIAFQSRFGRAEWLQPYTAETLADLGRRKTPCVDVMCPGFVSDCLETLEEIAIEGRSILRRAGGGEMRFIPCLNDSDRWIAALSELTARNLLGWIDRPPAGPQPHPSLAVSTGMGA
ncbi:MAG: ferrochelatase [Burkholderiales bacterium]